MDKPIGEEYGMNIYYQNDERPVNMSPHFHYLHEIIFVVEGSSEFTFGEKRYVTKPNTLVFISCLENHSLRMLEYPYKRYVITMNSDFTQMMLKQPALLSVLLQRPADFCHTVTLDTQISEVITGIFDRLLSECNNKEDFWLENTAAILMEMLVTLYRYSSGIFPVNESTGSFKIVFDIQKYIAKNYQSEISLDGLSKIFFVSKFYISRIFKKITGYKYKDYLILYRLSIAKEILFSTSNSVTDICAHCGYNNVNHFIRIFKSYVGMSPNQYRKLKAIKHLNKG